MDMPFQPNEGEKNLEIDTDYGRYARYPVKTHVITKDDVQEDILDKYVGSMSGPGDTIIMSEKIVAISRDVRSRSRRSRSAGLGKDPVALRC